jgi:hypothetical protein
MTWDPDFGCPVHAGEPYKDCQKCAATPPLTPEEEQALCHRINVDCEVPGCETCRAREAGYYNDMVKRLRQPESRVIG